MTFRDLLATQPDEAGRIVGQLTLPDDPAVLDLVAALTRSLGALAAAGSGDEVAAAHTVLTTTLAPAAHAAEGQWSRRPYKHREIAPGTGGQLPWGWWRAELSPAALADLHAAASVLAAARPGTDAHAAATALDRLLAVLHHPDDGLSLELVDAVLGLADDHAARR